MYIVNNDIGLVGLKEILKKIELMHLKTRSHATVMVMT